MQFFYWRQPYPLRRDFAPIRSFYELALWGQGEPDGVAESLFQWLAIIDVCEQRRYLEEHDFLLDQRCEGLLQDLLSSFEEHSRTRYQVQEDLLLLKTIRAQGSHKESIVQAYVDTYGAFAMDLPEDLRYVELALADFLDDRKRYFTVKRRMEVLSEAVEQARQRHIPELRATLERELAVAWSEYMYTERAQAFDTALELCVKAMEVYTFVQYPRQWAELQMLRGNIYMDRTNGGPWDNCAQSIACQTDALQVFQREMVPVKYAEIQVGLGIAYEFRENGEQREDREQAFVHYERALDIFTSEQFPFDYARTQLCMATAYWHRRMGERSDNIERALEHLRNALEIWTKEGFPVQHARLQHTLGIMYTERLAGNIEENREKGIFHTRVAAQVFSAKDFPVQHGQGLLNQGDMFLMRIAGEKRGNVEQAIAYLRSALRIRTKVAFPNEYAVTQVDLGDAYLARVAGDKEDNMFEAIACFEEAAQIWTVVYSPSDARRVQLSLAEVHANCGHWEEAHRAYSTAMEAEELMIALGSGIAGRDAILKEGRSAAIYNGYALACMGRVEDAVVSMEQGRARGIAEARTFMAAQPERIRDEERRTRYREVREALVSAQAELHVPLASERAEHERRLQHVARVSTYRKAKADFDVVVSEVRAANDPADFFNAPLDANVIAEVVERIGTRHALIYLAATPWGGVAIAVLGSQVDGVATRRFVVLDLPELTERWVAELLQRRFKDGTERVMGGYALAQEGAGYQQMINDWPGDTFAAKACALHSMCQELGQVSTLDLAAQEVLQSETVSPLVMMPLFLLSVEESLLLEDTFATVFLQQELRFCLERIGADFLPSIIAWMCEKEATSVTFIACGPLAAFPLSAAILPNGMSVGETLPTSVAPSARALVRDASVATTRSGVYALGDPNGNLEWSEAEALTIGVLARQNQMHAQVQLAQGATRDWLLMALQKGSIIDTCCHGTFDPRDVFNSALYLAQNEPMRMRELLSHQVDLRGLRLLMLSACQTAVLHTREVSDEVHSLASSMIHAGADAVLASLWTVDDKATYLLMVRFAQEWFPDMEHQAPAEALAHAQHWLRTVTNQELRLEMNKTRWSPKQPGSTLAASCSRTRLAEGEHIIAVRGRAQRLAVADAKLAIRIAAEEGEPLACPYRDAYYWAGFQIIGW